MHGKFVWNFGMVKFQDLAVKIVSNTTKPVLHAGIRSHIRKRSENLTLQVVYTACLLQNITNS